MLVLVSLFVAGKAHNAPGDRESVPGTRPAQANAASMSAAG
jgi:hypothetical protein